MDGFIDKLRDGGYKITPQRRAVINALQECGSFASARQVLDHVRITFPDMSLDTVYRNLSLLVDLGLVHEIHTKGRDGNVFEVSTGHHHHLICLGCGKAKCLDFCPIGDKDIEKAQESGFKVTFHSLDFYGYCVECRAAN